MPEPTTTAAAVLGPPAAAVTTLAIAGVSLGLRADELIAGFAGALVAIALLDAVPSSGDTARELVRTSMRRLFFALASAFVAGYGVPFIDSLHDIPQPAEVGLAFIIGASAQKFMRAAIDRVQSKVGGA